MARAKMMANIGFVVSDRTNLRRGGAEKMITIRRELATPNKERRIIFILVPDFLSKLSDTTL